jgi:hypothetical protein
MSEKQAPAPAPPASLQKRDHVPSVAEAKQRLKQVTARRDHAYASGDRQEYEAALREHHDATYALRDAKASARIAESNARAAADRAAREEAERERQANLPKPQHIPGRIAPKWTSPGGQA